MALKILHLGNFMTNHLRLAPRYLIISLALLATPLNLQPNEQVIKTKKSSSSLFSTVSYAASLIATQLKNCALPNPPSYDLAMQEDRLYGKGEEFGPLALSAMNSNQSNVSSSAGNLAITGREIEDLKLSYVLQKCERTRTAFGYSALVSQLAPVADLTIIQNRQEIIRHLVEDEDLFNEIDALLKKMHHYTCDVLSYFASPTPALKKENWKQFILHKVLHEPQEVTDDHYLWHLWGAHDVETIGQTNDYLNNNEKALRATSVLNMAYAASSVWRNLIQSNLIRDAILLFFFGRGTIDFPDLLWKPLVRTFTSHMLWAQHYKEGEYDKHAQLFNDTINNPDPLLQYTHAAARDYFRTLEQKVKDSGTWLDSIKLGLHGTPQENGGITLFGKDIKFPFIWWGLNISHYFKVSTDARINLSNEIQPKDYARAILGSMVLLAWDDYHLLKGTKDGIFEARKKFGAMNDMRRHLMHIKSFINTGQKLQKLLAKCNGSAAAVLAKRFDLQTQATESEQLKELLEKLNSATFKGTEDSWFYWGGTVLYTHQLLKKAKDELSTFLSAVGELDAYLSIATLVKQSRGSSTPWCLVDFETSTEPFLELEGAWLPLIPKGHVTNDFYFGGTDGHPSKMLLTGPNGGGKSSIIYTLGISTFCAQSWGIAPAAHARMTLFDQLIACLRSEENVFEDISTFMAALKDIEIVKKRVQEGTAKNQKSLLLIDEPYRGTVDAEAGERLYYFCKDVIAQPSLISVIATHLEKPTKIEQETNGALANYYVLITETDKGFKREYKLRRGLCDWWFNDATKRTKFVDWLTPMNKVAATAA